jgi:hypothetical protein
VAELFGDMVRDQAAVLLVGRQCVADLDDILEPLVQPLAVRELATGDQLAVLLREPQGGELLQNVFACATVQVLLPAVGERDAQSDAIAVLE